MSSESDHKGPKNLRLIQKPGPDSSDVWVQRKGWFFWKDLYPVVNAHRDAMARVCEAVENLIDALEDVEKHKDDVKNARKVIEEDVKNRGRSLFGPPGNVSNRFPGKAKPELPLHDCTDEFKELSKKWGLKHWLGGRGIKDSRPRGRQAGIQLDNDRPIDMKNEMGVDYDYKWNVNRDKNRGNQKGNKQNSQNNQNQNQKNPNN